LCLRLNRQDAKCFDTGRWHATHGRVCYEFARWGATSGLQKGCFRVVPTAGGGHEQLHDSGAQDGTIIILDQLR